MAPPVRALGVAPGAASVQEEPAEESCAPVERVSRELVAPSGRGARLVAAPDCTSPLAAGLAPRGRVPSRPSLPAGLPAPLAAFAASLPRNMSSAEVRAAVHARASERQAPSRELVALFESLAATGSVPAELLPFLEGYARAPAAARDLVWSQLAHPTPEGLAAATRRMSRIQRLPVP